MERYKRYKMPDNSVLILNSKLGILSLLSEKDLLQQQLLSPSETALIEVLLESYPQYCPTEILFAIHTGQDIENSHQQLLNASKDQTMHEKTKSLRAVLARCRKKLQPFDIEIITMLGKGCILKPLNQKSETDKKSKMRGSNTSAILA